MGQDIIDYTRGFIFISFPNDSRFEHVRRAISDYKKNGE